jgi:acyl-CoA reductase-like NAD-dependent aldehyde dehydrogenase
MAAAVSELNPKSRSRSDRERFGDILAVQRAAYLRDGAPSLTKRRGDLKKFKAAMLARRSAIEEAINTDFGHRSRHETAIMEILGVVQGIDYLVRNLRRFYAADSPPHRPGYAVRQQSHRGPVAAQQALAAVGPLTHDGPPLKRRVNPS